MAKTRAQIAAAARATAIKDANEAKKRVGPDPGPAKIEEKAEATTGEQAKRKGSGTTKRKTGTVIVPESEIVAALDGGAAVVPPPNATAVVGGTAPSDMDGLPKVTSTFFTQPPITPADMEMARNDLTQRGAAAAQRAADQAMVDSELQTKLRRLLGESSVAEDSPFNYDLGGLGGESLLPSPTPPPATPFDASGFPTVRLADEPQMSLGLPEPYPAITRGLAANDFDYIPQADGKPGRRGQPPVDRPPAQPYGIKNSLVGRLAGAAYKQAGPYIAPGVSKTLAAGLDAAVIGGGAAFLVPPLVRGAYNSMFPPAAAPAQSPAPGLPQQQAPMNGDEPDYMRQLRESTIGTRNSSDIIRNLSRNRGMA